MRVLVTGANGFIGSSVVRLLAARGDEVVCLLRTNSDTRRLANVDYERVNGDIRDRDTVRDAVARCDCTIHLAAPGGWEADDPDLMRTVIEGGARNVLDAVAGRPGHRVVLVSSTAAVDAAETPRVFDEDSPFTVDDPTLHYAHAKHRTEVLAREAQARGADVVIVNPAEVYGPGDVSLVTAGNLIDFAKSWPVLVTEGGTGIVHVEDVARGILSALEQGRPGERYILSGENITIRQLAELVLALVGRRAPVVSVPRAVGRAVSRSAVRWRIPVPYNPHVVPYATRYWFVSNIKARTELGLEFRDARATVASTITWLRECERLPAEGRGRPT